MSTLILVLYVLSTSLGLVVLKLGTTGGLPISLAENKLQFHFNIYSLSGLALYAVSFVLYLYLISKNDLGYIIPLATGLVYVVIFFASFVVLKEAFSATKILAIGLILMGVIILNVKK
ncbi:MAG TPA: hypothetical protein VMT30_08805 [Candidatus Saccharimonadia bacterium]|nr:hypothetical protein [Candidatus Saccharimonadia bacterium]